ncbi:AraC family transcriptional regulator [Cohnella rhizosphaerae]|uniref:AraC family transcriptional regulator n=1 Tax=Cohnella rhizosphaerae TaxID=1457232 RepID=A0A9X4KY24_9BACL|nr:AraC family transcriptional regulator [Cohnella rhizosphaerae]MDG0813424.1 AraC family transcriptional regulator [Cohnella rhizosphaerae]
MQATEGVRPIELASIRPIVHFAERAAYERIFVWGPRVNPDCQLLFVLFGRAELTLGPHRYSLSPGSCAFYGSGSPHRIETAANAPAGFYSIHFDWDGDAPVSVHPASAIRACAGPEREAPPVEYRIDAGGGRSPLLLANVLHAPELEPLFRPIVEEYREQRPGCEAAMRGGMTALLVALVRRQLQERPDPTARRIAPALAAIAREPARSWSSRELAQLCGYHPTYFAEIFREATGLSPKAYAMRERIACAKRLLLTGERITEIAQSLGYGDVHYFSRSFREATGLTPSAFRLRPEPETEREPHARREESGP